MWPLRSVAVADQDRPRPVGRHRWEYLFGYVSFGRLADGDRPAIGLGAPDATGRERRLRACPLVAGPDGKPVEEVEGLVGGSSLPTGELDVEEQVDDGAHAGSERSSPSRQRSTRSFASRASPRARVMAAMQARARGFQSVDRPVEERKRSCLRAGLQRKPPAVC